MDRREFLTKGLRRILYTLVAAFVAYPALAFMSYRKTVKKNIQFSPGEQLSGVNFKEGVYLIKREGEEYALSSRCTHLGCTLNFDPVSGRFRCPCHGSVFDLTGNRLEGPARAPLERVPLVRKENGEVVATLTIL